MGSSKPRSTIGRIMIAVAIVAVILAILPEPAFVIRLASRKTPAAVLPDGTIIWNAPREVHVTRFGALLVAGVLGAAVAAAAWVARRLFGRKRRLAPHDPE